MPATHLTYFSWRLQSMLFGLAILWPAESMAKSPTRFDVMKLAVNGEVLTVVPGDLDGDRRADLLVSFRQGRHPNAPRYFAVFWNHGEKFRPAPDLLLRIADDAAAFDVAPVDQEAGAELLTIGRHGVRALSLHGRKAGASKALTSDTTLFFRPSAAVFPRLRLIHNLAPSSGKTGSELVIPMLGEVAIYKPTPAGYVQIARLGLEIDGEISTGFRPSRASETLAGFSMSFPFPTIHVADNDGDGLKDIVVAGQGMLSVYRQQPGLIFAHSPTFHRDFRDHNASKETFTMATLNVADFDRDGLADLLVAKQVSRGLASVTADSAIYFGRKGGTFATTPDQVIRSEGPGLVEMVDLSGDGRLDLIVPTVSLGVWQIIRVLTSKSLKVTVQAFPLQPDRRFLRAPSSSRELKFQFSFSANTGLQAVEFHGDYNGDGRRDLAFGVARDELAIYLGGTDKDLLGSDPVAKINVHTLGELEVFDLDGKGRSDLILYDPAAESERGKVVVVINRGPW